MPPSRIAVVGEPGIPSVIIGSIAVKEPELVNEALEKFGGDKIVISIDCRNEHVATEGWLEESELRAIDVISKYRSNGLKNIIYTDIERDGMLTGPNTEAVEKLLKIVKINTSIAGGVSSIDDIKKVKKPLRYCLSQK